jgi:hypothetical protein
MAVNIQADFHAARMKAPAPVQFRMGLEIVPLETDTDAAHAAMEVAPAVADRDPGGPFGKNNGVFHDRFGWRSHITSVPAFWIRANFLSFGSQKKVKNMHFPGFPTIYGALIGILICRMGFCEYPVRPRF